MRERLHNFVKYKDLFIELVRKDIKLKYKNSYLGVLWSFLNPLLMMIVLTIIFSEVFKNNIENFPVYVLTGRLIYSFFSEATNFAMNSIQVNSQLIKKIYVPKYFFPLSKICSSFLTSLVSLIPILIVMIITRMDFSIYNLLVFIPLIQILLISAGIGLIIATIAVFFNDLKHLYSVLLMLLMYMTPIFYPEEIIPEQFKWIIELNPLYSVLVIFRDLLMHNQLFSLFDFTIATGYSIIYFFIGIFIFYKNQDKFIFHL